MCASLNGHDVPALVQGPLGVGARREGEGRGGRTVQATPGQGRLQRQISRQPHRAHIKGVGFELCARAGLLGHSCALPVTRIEQHGQHGVPVHNDHRHNDALLLL